MDEVNIHSKMLGAEYNYSKYCKKRKFKLLKTSNYELKAYLGAVDVRFLSSTMFQNFSLSNSIGNFPRHTFLNTKKEGLHQLRSGWF